MTASTRTTLWSTFAATATEITNTTLDTLIIKAREIAAKHSTYHTWGVVQPECSTRAQIEHLNKQAQWVLDPFEIPAVTIDHGNEDIIRVLALNTEAAKDNVMPATDVLRFWMYMDFALQAAESLAE